MEASGSQGRDPRREMIDALTDSVMSEDFAFFDSIVQNQEQLGAVEIAEYMDVKRRGSEDPVEANRWESGLRHYLQQFKEKELSEDEVTTLNGIVQNLEFDAITNNQETADKVEDVEWSDDDDKWEEATFSVPLEEEEVKAIRSLAWFQSAEDDAKNGYLNSALSKLEKMQGERYAKARQVMDWYVFQSAEYNAKNDYLHSAIQQISAYAYDEISGANMRSAIDKYVYSNAESCVKNGYLNSGEKIIRDCASTPGRRDAMLRRIGLM